MVGLAGDVDTVPSATALARQCVTYSLAFGLAGGLVGGLVDGLAFGLAVGNGNVWLRYLLGVRSAARHGALPKRPARFLDWCLDTGLMRMAGNSVQFRHRQLQDWLATRPRRSPPPLPPSLLPIS